jgi:hypothetical protein
LNNINWSPKDISDMKAKWDATKAPMSVFAHEYAAEVPRSVAAIRLKIGDLIRDGKFEPHGAEFSPAQVLVLDIETLPMVVYSWRIRDVTLSIENIIQDTTILSFAATWLYSGKVTSFCLTPKESKARDDRRVISEAWNMLERAEVVIAHYGRGFDLPKLNSRFLFYGLKPPSPYRSVDTAKDIPSLGLSSKKQDYILAFTHQKQKLETSYQLWKDCDRGDSKALKKMEAYNRNDVVTLEAMYTILRPWLANHPNIAAYEDHASDRCPKCNGRLTWTKSRWATPTKLYPTFRCKACGVVGRGRWAT